MKQHHLPKPFSRRRPLPARQALIEALEGRRLLTFSTVTPLSDVAAGTDASSTVALAGHFADPAQTNTTVLMRFEPYNGALQGGNVFVQLSDGVTPQTVANFLSYVNDGSFNNTIIHRAISGFIVQGGGYRNASGLPETASKPPVQNEYLQAKAAAGGLDVNVRGTIAMAKVAAQYDQNNQLIPGTGPDSATSEWFFNLVDNSDNLDNQNGGFTTFGTVTSGMSVVDTIAGLPKLNIGFGNPPATPFAGNGSATFGNLVTLVYATANATYTISGNTNSALVTPSIVGSQLVLNYAPGKVGSADLTVTATDFNGNTATDTFTVTVTQPVISVTADAQPVTDNQSTAVSIGSPAQGATTSKTFRITNAGNAVLNFSSQPTVPAGFVITSPATFTSLNPGQFVDFVVTSVATNSGGVKTGKIVFNTNDPDTAAFDLPLSYDVLTRVTSVSYLNTPITSGQGAAATVPPSPNALYNATFLIRNTGTGTLILGAPTLPAGYTLKSGLPATLGPNASTNLLVEIDTSSNGVKAGTITINSDDPITPAFSFPVTATVAHATIGVTLDSTPLTDNGSAVDFGTVDQNAPVTGRTKTFRIANNGDSVLTFTAPTVPAAYIITSPVIFSGGQIVPNLTQLAPGQSLDVVVAARADTGGDKMGTLVINSNDPNTPAFEIPLSGHVNYRKIEVSHNSTTLVFNTGTKLVSPAIGLGNVAESATVTVTYTVKNTGDELDLNLSAPTLPAGYSVVQALPSSLAPGASADLVLAIDTATVGAHSDIIVINSNDPLYALSPSGFRIPLTYTVDFRRIGVTSGGAAVAPGTDVSLGTQTQGDTPNRFTFRLANNGNLPLTLGTPVVPTGFKLVGTLPTILAVGATADVAVELDTMAVRGTYAGALTFTTNDPTVPQFSLDLSGKLLGKGIVVSLAGSAIPFGNASTVNFGKVRRGTAGQQVTFTVANSGVLPLALQATAIPAGYSVVSGLPDSLAPGASVQLTVTLDTSTSGTFNGQMHIVSSDPDRASFDIPLAAAVSLPVTLGKGGASAVSFTDADGTAATLTLSGPGTVVLDFFGNALSSTTAKGVVTVGPKGTASLDTLTFSGTNASASKLVVTTKGGNKLVDLGDFIGTPLNAVTAPGVTLRGSFGMSAKTLEFGAANGATITLGSGTTLSLASSATDTKLVAAGNLKLLRFTSWTGGSITASSIDALDVRQNLATDLVIKKGVAGTVKGNVTGGTWQVGSIGKLTVGGTASGWSAAVGGGVGTLTVTKSMAGSLSAKTIGTLAVGGTISGATIRATGRITSLSATSMMNSKVYAGVDATSTPPLTPAVFVGSGSIGLLSVKSFFGSSVAAKVLTKVVIGTLKTRNNGQAFGFAAKQIGSLTAKLDTGKSLTLTNIKSGTQLAAALKAQGITSTNDLRFLMA